MRRRARSDSADTAKDSVPTDAWLEPWPHSLDGHGRVDGARSDDDCWHHEIEKATSEAEILKSASDYLALWAPREIAPWSLGLSEMRIADPDDIERVKLHLSERPPKAASGGESHLRELASYFTRASRRISELRA